MTTHKYVTTLHPVNPKSVENHHRMWNKLEIHKHLTTSQIKISKYKF
jgi:hypothetical protein